MALWSLISNLSVQLVCFKSSLFRNQAHWVFRSIHILTFVFRWFGWRDRKMDGKAEMFWERWWANQEEAIRSVTWRTIHMERQHAYLNWLQKLLEWPYQSNWTARTGYGVCIREFSLFLVWWFCWHGEASGLHSCYFISLCLAWSITSWSVQCMLRLIVELLSIWSFNRIRARNS